MKSERPPEKFKNLSDAVLWLTLALLLVMTLSGCVTMRRAPAWEPHTYLYSGGPGGCKFIDGYEDTLYCDSPRMENFVLIPLDSLESAQDKFQRCEKWR